ncbi:alpha-2-macroglobulin-like protein [Sarotherodon galilaeus]
MMTRGGRKPGQEEQPDEGVGASSELEAMAATSPEDKLEELTGLVKSLMRSQAARDQKWEKDLSRQEQRWKGMQHQFQQIQLQVNAVIDKPDPPEAPAPPTTSEEQEHGFNVEDIPVASGSRSLIEPKLFPLSPEDNIEHFLTTFERMANVCRWPRDEWAIRLVPLLMGKARTAYILMDVTDSEIYDKVKEAILAKYEITADTYRRRFRSMKVEPGETPRELYVRLKDLFSRWIKPEKSTVEEISEQIILEQFLRMVNPELEIWIREHDPKTAKEAASLAEVFTSARKGSKSTYFSRETHYAQPIPRPATEPVGKKACTVPVLINGRKEEALLDSGWFQTLVHSSIISGEKLSGVGAAISCVHGDEHRYPTAEVYLTVGGQTYLLVVAVVPSLPYSVILGNDIPTLFDLIHQSDYDPQESAEEDIQGLGDESGGLLPLDMTVEPFKPCHVVTRPQSAKEMMQELPFFEESLETEPGKIRKSRAQKRREKFKGSGGKVERYNQTLKSMLRKFVSDTGADWDQWLPYLLFAYGEVPQVSTGFSPFELLYGRQVRGPLDLLKDCWEDPKAEGENIAAYVITMRERLEKMASLVQDNMKAAQKHQKTWYDQKARDRVFLPGQKVLLLLPTSDNKLLTKWHGPYEIVRQVSKVTYELNMPERVKKYQTFHVNLLKEFHSRQEPVYQLLANIKPLVDPQLFRETPGFTSLVQHKIRVKEDAPVRQKSYRIPERLVPVLQKEIKLMLDLGIIEVSSSEWCSPIVLVPKKDDTLRFCIDFRYLNAVSKFDPYPMPRVDDLLERVGSARYITTLDLCKGYWQVALAPEAKELTAFKTPFGMYQFKVMPFGLQGAPATFQRLMDHVLRDVSAFSAAYLDDVVVYSQSWEEHVIHLQKVLRSIRMAGLTINPKKCSIAKREVEYLGFVVGSGKIKPQVGKIEAIQSFPVPTTKRKVRGFLGLVGWYRKFIPSFAERSTVLNDLTKGSAPNKVRWTEDCEQAFGDLKEAVCTHPVLHSPDFNKPFILQTDASGVGLGAVLQQEVDGERRPVVFLSRKLLDRETRYSTVEKECLAMKWAIEALRYYLLGRHFTLETDHRALQWLNRMRDANARIAGWYLSLQPYDFTVQYRPGKSNVVADCLSRMTED